MPQLNSSIQTIVLPSHLAAYSDLFNRMVDATLLIDLNTFCVLETNPATEAVLGMSAAAMKGRPVTRWVLETQRQQFEKELRVARRRYYPRQTECVWQSDDGKSRVVEIVACVLELSNGTGVLQIIAKDITQVREAEARASKYLQDLQAANEKLAALSITDEMTGLHNFRHFKEELRKEHERAHRYGTPYSIIFCDVDHFKHYNDHNGHQAGDEVLKAVAQIIKKMSRNTDLPARYGGEEFTVLCPGVNWEGAQILGERIRAAVEAHKFLKGEAQPLGKLTVSVGVASFPLDGATEKEVIENADQAAYVSKQSGRNRMTPYREVKLSRQIPTKPSAA